MFLRLPLRSFVSSRPRFLTPFLGLAAGQMKVGSLDPASNRPNAMFSPIQPYWELFILDGHTFYEAEGACHLLDLFLDRLSRGNVFIHDDIME